MERVFHEMGAGSVRSLHAFYQMRVLKYHERMLNECNALHDEYSTLALPVCRPAGDSEIIRYSPYSFQSVISPTYSVNKQFSAQSTMLKHCAVKTGEWR
jgi:hypothetical protein